MALDISQIIRVNARLQPSIAPSEDQDRTLFVWAPTAANDVGDAARAARHNMRGYGSLEAVAEDYTSGEEPYQAAQTYFSQTSYPKNLVIAPYYSSGQIGLIHGDVITVTGNQLRGLDDDAFTFLGAAGTLADFSGLTSLSPTAANGLAKELSDALNAITGVTGAAVLALPPPGATSLPTWSLTAAMTFRLGISYPVSLLGVTGVDADAGFTGAAAETLGLAGATQVTPWANPANFTAGLDAISRRDDAWYWLVLSNTLTSTAANVTAASEWAEPRRKMFGFDTNLAGTLTPNESASPAALLDAADRERSFGAFSRTQDHKAISIASYFSAVDYEGAGTLVTGNLAPLPNTIPDSLTESARTELRRKRVNFYESSAGVGVLREGWTFTDFIDARAFVDWLVGDIQLSVFNTLRQSRRVPLTTAGIAVIRDAIIQSCQRGVRNGGIAPGTVGTGLRAAIAQATGDAEFDGVLTSGYLVYIPPANQVSESDRAARTLSGVRVFVNGSAAIHNVEIDLTFRS